MGFARAVYRADGRDPDGQTIIRLAPGDAAPERAALIEVRVP